MDAILANGVVVFGAVLFLVILPLTWVLERLGIIREEW